MVYSAYTTSIGPVLFCLRHCVNAVQHARLTQCCAIITTHIERKCFVTRDMVKSLSSIIAIIIIISPYKLTSVWIGCLVEASGVWFYSIVIDLPGSNQLESCIWRTKIDIDVCWVNYLQLITIPLDSPSWTLWNGQNDDTQFISITNTVLFEDPVIL